jgi:hypothetical protein
LGPMKTLDVESCANESSSRARTAGGKATTRSAGAARAMHSPTDASIAALTDWLDSRPEMTAARQLQLAARKGLEVRAGTANLAPRSESACSQSRSADVVTAWPYPSPSQSTMHAVAASLTRMPRDAVSNAMFEVRRDRRRSARPGGGMIDNARSRAWCFAVGPRLDRGVRRHFSRPSGSWGGLRSCCFSTLDIWEAFFIISIMSSILTAGNPDGGSIDERSNGSC